MEPEKNNNQIHCKLTYNDQIRRFIFNGIQFNGLRSHISSLLELPQDGFVLKYIDNESDRITLTSDEDLALALTLSDKLLRLVVEVPSQPPLSNSQVLPVFPQQFQSRPPYVQQVPTFIPTQGASGYIQQVPAVFPQQPPNYGHHSGKGNYYHREMAKARIMSKVEMLKQTLEQIPPEEQSYRKQHIQMKIHHLENKLLRWDTIQEKKLQHQQHRKEKKWDNNKRLDPQTLNQIEILKGQVASLKFNTNQLKAQKKAKKGELQVCLQTGTGDKEAIWKEILILKESIHEKGKQIASLKDQIRALRGF